MTVLTDRKFRVYRLLSLDYYEVYEEMDMKNGRYVSVGDIRT